MTKNIVIVESPAKAQTIKKYLNSIPELEKYGSWDVIASYGHIRDLDKKEMGIDINNKFTPHYILINNAWSKKAIKNLKEQIKEADMIWLAADLDREGEAIAWHIQNYFKLTHYKRITFNEITKDALKNAVLNPRKIDMNMVHSQEARRVLDRLVGFSITPLLWKTFKTNIVLSAGRVQSATLNIIINKENDILKHVSSSYYHAIGYFMIKQFEVDDAKYLVDNKIYQFENSEEIKKFLKSLLGNNKYKLNDVSYSVKTIKPPPPFITSTLQQSASELNMSIKQIMANAQVLYEAGIITYMRTDSTNLSQDAVSNLSSIIKTQFGDNYLQQYNKGNKVKGAQEAHEGIRPAKPDLNPSDLKLTSKIKKEHQRLYELIWKRTISSLMTPAKVYEIQISIIHPSFEKNQKFMGKFKLLQFEGYKIIYGEKADPNLDIVKYTNNISDNQSLLKPIRIIGKNIWTVPPTRFSEPTLVKTLEIEGIGRPSTYASIMTKLFDKSYIDKRDISGEIKLYVNYMLEPLKDNKIIEEEISRPISEEKGRLVPLDIGIQINDFMLKYFKPIIDVKFTSKVESDFDKIAEGEDTYLGVMTSFYKDFSKLLELVQGEINTRKKSDKNSSKIELKSYTKDFRINNKDYTVRIAKYGPVIQIKSSNTKEGDKDEYLSIVPYLKATKKTIEDITEGDIKLLTSLPKNITKKGKREVILKYSRYGFYLSLDGKNYTIYPQYIKYVINGDTDELLNIIKDK